MRQFEWMGKIMGKGGSMILLNWQTKISSCDVIEDKNHNLKFLFYFTFRFN